MQSPISNDCLKVSIDVQNENYIVPKLLLQVSIREIHNIMVIQTDEEYLWEARFKKIISDSALHTILRPQLKSMSAHHKVMCRCRCCISAKICILTCYHVVIVTWRNLKTKVTTLTTEGLVK